MFNSLLLLLVLVLFFSSTACEVLFHEDNDDVLCGDWKRFVAEHENESEEVKKVRSDGL